MKTKEQIYDELTQELGIPLEVLFKVLKEQEVYVKDGWGNVFKTRIKLYYFQKWIIQLGSCHDYSGKDYGKTWALTKEELDG